MSEPKDTPGPSAEPEVPEGWERTRNSNGLVYVSAGESTERDYQVSWWAAHHNALYVEGYDYAATIPLAVLRGLLATQGLAIIPAGDVPSAEEPPGEAVPEYPGLGALRRQAEAVGMLPASPSDRVWDGLVPEEELTIALLGKARDAIEALAAAAYAEPRMERQPRIARQRVEEVVLCLRQLVAERPRRPA